MKQSEFIFFYHPFSSQLCHFNKIYEATTNGQCLTPEINEATMWHAVLNPGYVIGGFMKPRKRAWQTMLNPNAFQNDGFRTSWLLVLY
jgi:hypothetical protein